MVEPNEFGETALIWGNERPLLLFQTSFSPVICSIGWLPTRCWGAKCISGSKRLFYNFLLSLLSSSTQTRLPWTVRVAPLGKGGCLMVPGGADESPVSRWGLVLRDVRHGTAQSGYKALGSDRREQS